jgi:nitrate reductase gamma subunit
MVIALLIGCLGLFGEARAQEQEMMKPVLEGKERVCLDCHRTPNINATEGDRTSQALCYECHGLPAAQRKAGQIAVSLQVLPDSFGKSRHRFLACLHCHTDVARSPHKTVTGARCLACHNGHGEGAVGDPHRRVSCQACHRKSKAVFLDKASDQVELDRFNEHRIPIGLTDHGLPDTRDREFCLKCHFPNNAVGASAAVLPSKSLVCLVCHNAPLAVGQPVFWIALAFLILGLLGTVLFWFRGSVGGEERSGHQKLSQVSESLWGTIFSREIGPILKTVWLDIFLQRRLLQESVKRWSIHSLIYLSILLRFGLSLFTLFVYRFSPGSGLARALIDKNFPFVAFANDFLGLLIVIGLFWAFLQRLVIKPPHVLTEGRDNWALGIIGALVVLGFVTEGARILITRIPERVAVYSFVGYPLSNLFSHIPWDWPSLYYYLWYAHALLGALLIAYLPFGKMKHVLITPLTLILSYKRK